MTEYAVVFMTAASMAEAETIAHVLVEERLTACVNLLPGCRSVFHWEGEIQTEHEVFMIAKTRQEAVDAVIQRVRELHSYDEPEVIALSIEAGSAGYLRWIDTEMRKHTADS